MNDLTNLEHTNSQKAQQLIGWSWVSYLLHLLVAVAAVVPGANASIALLLLALILDWIKKDEAYGTWQQSHFDWRIRTVLWAGLAYLVTAPLWVLMVIPGWMAWTAISIWFLVRIVRGVRAMNKGLALTL